MLIKPLKLKSKSKINWSFYGYIILTLSYSVGRRSFSWKIEFGDPGTEAKWRVLEQSVRGWVLDSASCWGYLSSRWIWSTDQNKIKGEKYKIYQNCFSVKII